VIDFPSGWAFGAIVLSGVLVQVTMDFVQGIFSGLGRSL